MKKLVLFGLLLALSVFVRSDESDFQIEVLQLSYPTIEMQFKASDADSVVHFKQVIGSRGHIAINVWFEHDQVSLDLIDLELNAKQLSDYWSDSSQSLSLPYDIPTTTSSFGSRVGITVIAQKNKNQRYQWQRTEDFLSETVKSKWIPTDSYSLLKQQIQQNQISDLTIHDIADDINQRNRLQQCELVLQADLKVIKPTLSQCQVVPNPVVGVSMLDNRCKNLTNQWFDYVIAKNRNLCLIPAALSKNIWPESKETFNTALYKTLSGNTLNEFAELEGVTRGDRKGNREGNRDILWLEQQVKTLAVSDDVKKSFSSYQRYSEKLLGNMTASQNDLDQFVSKKPFRDFLLSELIRSIVTKQFKARNQFADWCQASFKSEDITESCFKYAADVSVRFFDIYGFKDLIEFNRSIEAYRVNFTKWSDQAIGIQEGKRSKAYIIEWAAAFSESLFEKPHCANETLFPFGNIMLNASDASQPPAFGSFLYPDDKNYQDHIDQLAKNKEAFVQEIWQQLSHRGTSQKSSSICVQQLLDDESFSNILSRVEYFPYD